MVIPRKIIIIIITIRIIITIILPSFIIIESEDGCRRGEQCKDCQCIPEGCDCDPSAEVEPQINLNGDDGGDDYDCNN